MKPVRLLHASDIHLDSARAEAREPCALKGLVDLSRACGADLMVIAGDLFDHNRVDAEVIEFTLDELHRAAIPVVLLPGNHDCLVVDSVYKRFPITERPSNVSVFTAAAGEWFTFPQLDLAVWGRPLTTYGGRLHPMAGSPPRNGERWQVAVAHGYYVGRRPDPVYSFQVSEDEIAGSQWDYVALGHWPGFQCVCDAPVKAFYSGSASETGTAAVVDFLDSGVQVRCERVG